MIFHTGVFMPRLALREPGQVSLVLARALFQVFRDHGFHNAKHRNAVPRSIIEFELTARVENLVSGLGEPVSRDNVHHLQIPLNLDGVKKRVTRPASRSRKKMRHPPRDRSATIDFQSIDLLTIEWAHEILRRGFRGQMRFADTLARLRLEVVWLLEQMRYRLMPPWAFVCPMNSVWVSYPSWSELARSDGASPLEIERAIAYSMEKRPVLSCGQRGCDHEQLIALVS